MKSERGSNGVKTRVDTHVLTRRNKISIINCLELKKKSKIFASSSVLVIVVSPILKQFTALTLFSYNDSPMTPIVLSRFRKNRASYLLQMLGN